MFPDEKAFFFLSLISSNEVFGQVFHANGVKEKQYKTQTNFTYELKLFL